MQEKTNDDSNNNNNSTSNPTSVVNISDENSLKVEIASTNIDTQLVLSSDKTQSNDSPIVSLQQQQQQAKLLPSNDDSNSKMFAEKTWIVNSELNKEVRRR
jgi:hypothetical protein